MALQVKEPSSPPSPLTTFMTPPPLFPGQTSCILHYNAFSVMQMLDFVFIFIFYYLLLYRVNAVKSIDLYQNYLSEKKKNKL